MARSRNTLVRVVVTLAALAVVLVGADLAARAWATGRVERELQSRLQLPQRPDVTVAGGSFLLQALRGRYEDVDVTAARVPGGDVVLDDVRVRLPAVHAPLRALAGGAGTVDVGPGTFTASVAFAELLRQVDTGGLDVRLSRDGDDVRASTSVRLFGLGVELALTVEPRLEDGAVRLVPLSARAAGQEVSLGRARQLLSSAGVDLLEGWSVALDDVPGEVAVRSLQVTDGGVLARGDVLATSTELG
ncbi:LmeA family phospholipid-binding protein [Kineococcus sp. SYSU DK005]|uniref:LmeA family phospholipid-binding protein n=1 Tax=Kineococcus sp. SYSU DK005 TaxID=3383126 RepID=UPI003D7C7E0C